jgi:hypothetical protein
MRGQEYVPSLKVPRQWPLFLLVEVSFSEGKALGSEEGETSGCRSCYEQYNLSISIILLVQYCPHCLGVTYNCSSTLVGWEGGMTRVWLAGGLLSVERSSYLRVFYGSCSSRADRALVVAPPFFTRHTQSHSHTQNKTLFTVVLFIESTIHFNNVVNF